MKRLIELFTDPEDVVIDPVAGSGSTIRAAVEMNRNAYGFEIKKEFYKKAQSEMLSTFQTSLFWGSRTNDDIWVFKLEGKLNDKKRTL